MKNYEKLLIVMLVITVITSILTVSVCAVDLPTLPKLPGTKPQALIFDYDGTYYLFEHDMELTSATTQYEIGNNSNTFILRQGSIDWEEIQSSNPNLSKLAYDSTGILLSTNKVQIESYCDGTTCPATDLNYDNICDDCGKAFTFNLRNDTYNFNGFYLPSAIEDESGVIVNLNNYWNETLSVNEGNLVILNGASTDNALLYYFSPDVVFSDGQVVTTGKTQVTLYKPSTNENGYLYWKKSATDTWNTSGALVASVDKVDWVANAVTDENGYTAISGDVNFQTPLWVEIQGVTEGEMTVQLPKMGGTMKTLVVCGVGLMACLVVLSLFGKRSLIFRN